MVIQHPNTLSPQSKLERYIVSLSGPQLNTTSVGVRDVVKKSLDVTSLAIVGGARVGMVMNCLTGASTLFNQPIKSPVGLTLGIGSGAAVVVNLGAMSAFTMLKIIDEITRAKSEEEQALALNDISACKKGGLAVFSLITGLVAQVPLAYATYKSALIAPWPFAIFQLLDCGRTAYSINQALAGFFEKNNETQTPIEEQLAGCKKLLIEKIHNFRRALADEATDHNKLLEKMQQETGVIASDAETPLLGGYQSADAFISSLLSSDVPRIAPPPPLNAQVGMTLDTFSFGMAAVVLSKFWMLGGQAADDMVASFSGNVTGTGASGDGNMTEVQKDVIYYMSAILVTLANTYIWVTLIKKATRFAADLFRNAVPSSITKTLHGRVHNVVTATGSLLACLLFVPQFYFAKLAFPDQPRYYYPVGAVSTVGTALGGIGATFALRDLLLARFTNSKKGRALLKLDSDLQQLQGFLSKGSSQDFAAFLLSLSDANRMTLQSPERLSIEEYINVEEA